MGRGGGGVGIQTGMIHRGEALILEVVQGFSSLHLIKDRCYHPYIQLPASWEVGLPLLFQGTTLNLPSSLFHISLARTWSCGSIYLQANKIKLINITIDSHSYHFLPSSLPPSLSLSCGENTDLPNLANLKYTVQYC